MNALMRLNQLKPGLQYKLVSQTGPVHAPIFTMSVEVDGNSFEASGPSKKTAKLHVAVKVSVAAASMASALPSSWAPLEPLSPVRTLGVGSMKFRGRRVDAELVRLLNAHQVTCQECLHHCG